MLCTQPTPTVLVHHDDKRLRRLPDGLTVRRLDLRNCPNLEQLPDGLQVRALHLVNCPRVTTLPAGLRCHELRAPGSNLTALPDDIQVDFRLDLSESRQLVELPSGLRVGTLNLSNCTALTGLPDGLEVCFLNLQGCSQLVDWPARLRVSIGRLNLRGCTRLTCLPACLGDLTSLDLGDCPALKELPPRLRVSGWIDVAATGLTGLPEPMRGVQVRWRGVVVSERIAFQPETLTVDEILHETNTEVRRVMLERVGFEWFLDRTQAEELDADQDTGGRRRLLRIPLNNDEPLVCVSVRCPSTERQYVLRVPPATTTCRQAAAWLAGFDDPAAYQPVVET